MYVYRRGSIENSSFIADVKTAKSAKRVTFSMGMNDEGEC